MTTNPHAPSDYVPVNPIARRVLDDPAVCSNAHVEDDALVLARRSHLLVHQPTRLNESRLEQELRKVAKLVLTPDPSTGSDGVHDEDPGGKNGGSAGLLADIEVWRLEEPDRHPHDEARRLCDHGGAAKHTTHTGATVEIPCVTPNHVAIVSVGRGSGCPAGPPHEAGRPRRPFIGPYENSGGPSVTVLDTGYIGVDPPHERLDERVVSVPGMWLDTSVHPAVWKPNDPDEITTDAEGRLVGIVGHGTFVAGQIAHVCPQAAITVVGHRDNEVAVGNGANQHRLWASELSLAHSLWRYRESDVIQCGFAFPTLDDQPSLPFTMAMTAVKAAHPGIAVVSPAGNEESRRRYWPAALPDVIGVAATKHDGGHRAWFSNWGPWVDCCAIGAGVRSTYIHWEGQVEDEDPDLIEDFDGWARWDGTSFAAPKVAAAIARAVAEHPGWTPAEAYEKLVHGQGGVEVGPVFDEMWPDGVLTELRIH